MMQLRWLLSRGTDLSPMTMKTSLYCSLYSQLLCVLIQPGLKTIIGLNTNSTECKWEESPGVFHQFLWSLPLHIVNIGHT